jgi:putative transposase
MPDWPHSPLHRLGEGGAYMVTAATYNKQLFLSTPSRLTLVRDMLFELAQEMGWLLQAWAVLPNHYHLVAHSPHHAETLRPLIRKLHSRTSTALNRQDGTIGRRVWYQYWDTLLTYERSYFARLNYVHQNPVKHGLVRQAAAYRWCSARWFARTATAALYRRITDLPTDRLNVVDFPVE